MDRRIQRMKSRRRGYKRNIIFSTCCIYCSLVRMLEVQPRRSRQAVDELANGGEGKMEKDMGAGWWLEVNQD